MFCRLVQSGQFNHIHTIWYDKKFSIGVWEYVNTVLEQIFYLTPNMIFVESFIDSAPCNFMMDMSFLVKLLNMTTLCESIMFSRTYWNSSIYEFYSISVYLLASGSSMSSCSSAWVFLVLSFWISCVVLVTAAMIVGFSCDNVPASYSYYICILFSPLLICRSDSSALSAVAFTSVSLVFDAARLGYRIVLQNTKYTFLLIYSGIGYAKSLSGTISCLRGWGYGLSVNAYPSDFVRNITHSLCNIASSYVVKMNVLIWIHLTNKK